MSRTELRNGAIGALMDEYERALNGYKKILTQFTQEEFEKVVDLETENKNCESVQSINSHVVRAGYAYSNDIRDKFGDETLKVKIDNSLIINSPKELNGMFAYMLETMEIREYDDERELLFSRVSVPWDQDYDVEQLLEHAIVHLLRHRRQLERFKMKYFC